MDAPKHFNHQEVEKRLYDYWLHEQLFNSKPDDRTPYTVVMPPPNVTGILHMGHCLNNTIQDILVRRARQDGKNVCWVPGTDHASIATEAKVVAQLKEQGIAKSSLTREKFLEHAWAWKKKYGDIILDQLKKLGCSLDWNRTTFTMDDHYYHSVMKIFVQLYQEGYIYRAVRMVNWDTKALTALSDEEVIYKETQSQLYYVRYRLLDESDKPYPMDHPEGCITVATVRPETILGDVAICVNPKDERYKKLHNRFALIPIINRKIPIITDEYVDMEFGTGCLKITPAHDINDYQIGLKYKLPVIDCLEPNGTMTKEMGVFAGLDRFEARKKMVALIEKEGLLLKKEAYTNQLGYSERTDTVIEPRLSLQWWVKMSDLAKPALDSVMKEDIKLYPTKFKNLYKHWIENVKDWCISRQLWWGHRIPAWYNEQGDIFVATSLEQLLIKYPQLKEQKLKQDEDCLDTWFSSWLWPLEVFRGMSNPDNNKDLAYYYPTNTLVTAPEIIFFWVARMIIAGYKWSNTKPFTDVYFTGIVRDKQGRKMSKSLGNSPDLLSLIEQHGCDATRFGIMIASPAGNDLLFDEELLIQGRNFVNKMWNASKLLSLWQEKADTTPTANIDNDFAIQWFACQLESEKINIQKLLDKFQLSEALKILHSLIWNDFCGSYLELVKNRFKGQSGIPKNVVEQSQFFFVSILQLLHPFMPFITEEIVQTVLGKDRIIHNHLNKQAIKVQSLVVDPLMACPIAKSVNKEELLKAGRDFTNLTTKYRNVLQDNNLKCEQPVFLQTANKQFFEYIQPYAAYLTGSLQYPLEITQTPIQSALKFTYEGMMGYFVPNKPNDPSVQIASLEKDLAYQEGFLASVQKKLTNEKFIANAKPEVIAIEQKKLADAQERIATLQLALKDVKGGV
ncbi:MAG: valine--tRNA ligase [Phycisphaerales bacterium]|nr:valine--tRNA ligase [Phycisphaerales bacterium]